jgi:glycosyltransferase involved in cell wall biosynthesis
MVGGTQFSREPDYPEELRGQAAALGLTDVLEFTGQVEDARPWMRAASVVIHSSVRPEPFGLVMVEAMMQERPVVGFRQGGAAEIIVDGETGRLVPVSDARAMAEATLSLLQDEAARIAMGQAGRRRALARFEAGVMTRAIEHVYDRVVGVAPQAPRRSS